MTATLLANINNRLSTVLVCLRFADARLAVDFAPSFFFLDFSQRRSGNQKRCFCVLRAKRRMPIHTRRAIFSATASTKGASQKSFVRLMRITSVAGQRDSTLWKKNRRVAGLKDALSSAVAAGCTVSKNSGTAGALGCVPVTGTECAEDVDAPPCDDAEEEDPVGTDAAELSEDADEDEHA
jgi:hypothetical protein